VQVLTPRGHETVEVVDVAYPAPAAGS